MTKVINTEIIEIEYESKDKKEVEKIKEAIRKNSLILKDLVSPYTRISFIKTPNAIEVSSYEDFKDFINSRLEEYLTKLKESLSKNADTNEVVYLKFLLLEKYNVLKNYSPAFAFFNDTATTEIYTIYLNYIF